MSAWTCPHDLEGVCQHVAGARCDPGMRGCVLHGRVTFANPPADTRRKPRRAGPPTEPAPPKRRRLPF